MDGGPWSKFAVDETDWGQRKSYTIFSANYLNWLDSKVSQFSSRIAILRDVTNQILNSVSGVNVGLMRFSNNHSGDPFETRAQGGMIIHEMVDIDAGRASLVSIVDSLVADGFTPLSETLYEAGLYFQGKPVDFG